MVLESAMYINFWYPVVRSEELALGKPEKVRVVSAVVPEGNYSVAGKAVRLSSDTDAGEQA